MVNNDEYNSFTTSIAYVGYAIIYPRFEKVSSSKEGEIFFYEILSNVYINDHLIDPEIFYNEIEPAEMFNIYKKILNVAESNKFYKVGINTSVYFVTLGYLESLVKCFPKLEFFVEISEKTLAFEINALKYYIEKRSFSGRIRFLLDDFGMQGANFSAVKDFSFHGIKLSKECFWDFYNNNQNLLFEIIHYLKLNSEFVVIEGVDSEEKMLLCSSLGVLMQGHYIEK